MGVVCGLLVALVAAGGVVAALLVWRRWISTQIFRYIYNISIYLTATR